MKRNAVHRVSHVNRTRYIPWCETVHRFEHYQALPVYYLENNIIYNLRIRILYVHQATISPPLSFHWKGREADSWAFTYPVSILDLSSAIGEGLKSAVSWPAGQRRYGELNIYILFPNGTLGLEDSRENCDHSIHLVFWGWTMYQYRTQWPFHMPIFLPSFRTEGYTVGSLKITY